MEQQEQLHVTVNGEDHTLACDPDVPLLDVLRAGLGLAGPRFGCGLGLCGACLVIIDGKARSSCDYPAWAAEGTEVTTVEGLPAGGALHAVQQAFLDEQAAQCGYCTSGMIVAAAALLAVNPEPTGQEVRAVASTRRTPPATSSTRPSSWSTRRGAPFPGPTSSPAG